MRKFVGQAETEKYKVGCTGQTVYLYDASGAELAKFKDIKYGYMPLFSPDKDLFVVKSTGGWMAAYSAGRKCLIKKWPLKEKASQDDGFCFSPDGKFLYNIERASGSVATELAVYETENWQEVNRYFVHEAEPCYDFIEAYEDGLYLLGFLRGEKQLTGIVDQLANGDLLNRRELSEAEYQEIQIYTTLLRHGFTENIIELYRPLYEMELQMRGKNQPMTDWRLLPSLPRIHLKDILERGFISPFFRD